MAQSPTQGLKLILRQTLSERIHRPGSVILRQLGEVYQK